jgi:hypothetical protein
MFQCWRCIVLAWQDGQFVLDGDGLLPFQLAISCIIRTQSERNHLSMIRKDTPWF